MNSFRGRCNLAFAKAISILTFFLLSHDVIAQVDYRNYQSPIKNQGSRGTCTAFSVAAVLEATPFMPTDVSERYLYAALRHSQPNVTYQEGDGLINYKNILATYGVVAEAVMPHNAQTLDWSNDTSDFTSFIKAAQTGNGGLYQYSKNATYGIKGDNFVHMGAATIHDVKQLKNILDVGVTNIAVVYTNVHIPVWSQTKTTASNPFIPTISVDINGERKRYIDIFTSYEGDLTDDIFTGKLPYYLIDSNENMSDDSKINNYGDLAVNIVGYNEKGFIFKNSWGTNWGDKGYGYISYAAHKLMSREGLFFGNIEVLYPENEIPLQEDAVMDLKTTLYYNENAMPNFYVTLAQPATSYNLKKAEFIIYDSQNKELVRDSITFKDDTEKLLGFAPFKDKVIPAEYLKNNGYLNINATITGSNDQVINRYYRAVTLGAGLYYSRDVINAHIIEPPVMDGATFNEMLVFENNNMGFNISTSDFYRALQNSKVDFAANSTFTHCNVFYKDQPFKYAAFKFNYDDVPKLVEVELVFNSEKEAKSYFTEHYSPEKFEKYNAVLEKPMQTTMYLNQETYPRQAQVWYSKNKVFIIAKLKNSKWNKQ
jgi:hypothetical protein